MSRITIEKYNRLFLFYVHTYVIRHTKTEHFLYFKTLSQTLLLLMIYK